MVSQDIDGIYQTNGVRQSMFEPTLELVNDVYPPSYDTTIPLILYCMKTMTDYPV